MDLRKEIYFYANLAAFPATGALNCLYVASATGIIYTWNGSSYVASGPGPVPTGLNYQGSWDANANLPLITSSVGTVGNYYIVGTAGTTNINGINDWNIGDWIIFSSTGVWQKIDNSDLEGYNLIQDEGVALTKQGTIDFQGEGVSASNDALNSKTVVSIPGTVNVDGVSITGDGSTANPLTVTSTSSTPTSQVVLFADLATTEALKSCTYNNGTLGVGATLTGNANGQLSTVSFTGKIDNVTTALNQIILVKNQSNQTQNGLYLVTQLGDGSNPFILTRTTDADTQAELYPIQVNVFGGATQANFAFLQKTVDPIIGTNNIVFTTTQVGITNTPVLHVDTVTSAALPACTYTTGANPTLPGSGAFLEANVNGAIGTINGVLLVNGNRILVKDQVNAAHNGDYTVAVAGSGSTKWKLIRSSSWGTNFVRLQREWKVNNPSSTKYGARYSTSLNTLSNTDIGTINIVFSEATVKDSDLSLSDITTNDVSTSKHGFAPKAPNDTTKFLRGDGTWAVPASSSGRFGIADSAGAYTYYNTLTLAMAAAVAGQTIEVFTDYTEAGAVTVTLKPSVTINGNGHTYTHNGGANVFKINDNGTYAILGLNVTKTGGGGTAVIVTTPDLYPGQPALNTSTNLSGSTFKSDGSGIYCSLYDVNEFYYGKIVMTGGGVYGLYGASTNFSHFSIEGLAAYTGTICFSGQLNMCYIVNRGSGLAVSDLSIADSYVVSYSSQTAGGINAARNCFFFSGTGAALQPANNGVIDNCKMYSSASAAATLYNTNATFNNCSMYSNAAQGFYAALTQTVELNNCVIQSGSNIALEALAPIVSNCVIESLWNNANGHAVKILNSSFLIQKCSIKVANASANCLYATAAVSPKYVANSFQGATTPVNANITQGMINTEDNFGNILI